MEPPLWISSDERKHGQGESGRKSSAEKANITPNTGTMPRPVGLQTSKEPRSPRDENTHGSVPAPRREEATRIISGGPQRKPLYFFTNGSCEPGEKAKLGIKVAYGTVMYDPEDERSKPAVQKSPSGFSLCYQVRAARNRSWPVRARTAPCGADCMEEQDDR